MINIALEIISNWMIMGVVIWVFMVVCLYFAVLCEKITDYFVPTK